MRTASSRRTALSFAMGMTELGGEYFLQNWEDSNFAVGEIQDEVRFVGLNVDAIMARLKSNADINLMAKYSAVPVINGCCDKYHPTQAIADLMTIKEIFGDYKVRLLYVGVKNNVLNSLVESLPRLGGELFAFSPLVNDSSADDELYQRARNTGRYHELSVGATYSDLKQAVSDADVIYTDTWVDMEFINDKKYAEANDQRVRTMIPFQINDAVLAGSKAMIMHDMPIHAGYEISRDVVENHIATILQQAANRKYSAKSILLTLLDHSQNSKSKSTDEDEVS